MLDVHELNIFVTAAETENFSEAARQLNLTQPAVSMQMRSLEKKLGIELFYRSGRTLALTERGKVLVPLARDVVRRTIQIEEEIETLKGKVVGRLMVGCSTTTGKYYLPSLVARFRDQYPGVQVTISNHGRDAVLKDMCDGNTHLAIVSALPVCNDAEFRHFFDDHLVLIVPRHHSWAGLEVISPQMLYDANFILRTAPSGTREGVEAALRETGINPAELNVVMEIGNSEAISIAVEEGIGVAFVSRTVARRGIKAGKLKEVRVQGLSVKREIYIAYSHRHPATKAQTAFWNFLQTEENMAFLQSIS